MYLRVGKRVFDCITAGVVLVLLSPVLIVLAMAIRFVLGAPVLFRQERPGLGGRPFTLYKFRTMTEARDGSGEMLDDGRRLTAFGRVLRRFSFDELPEFWNVLRGDMSLVGPRPLLMEYLPLYSPEQARRHEVRPGLTGWAQVNGRNALSWDEKFRLDVWYVNHVSLPLDIRVICRTFALVARGAGVSSDAHPTMPKFNGSRS